MSKKVAQEKKVSHTFTIDCSKPVEDKVFNTSNFAEYLRARIKVEDKVGNLGDRVTVSSDATKLTVSANIAFSKRYLKYLTKKYLKKQALRDFLRIIATPNSKNSYVLKYFEVTNEEA